jgi:hypothetical protein
MTKQTALDALLLAVESVIITDSSGVGGDDDYGDTPEGKLEEFSDVVTQLEAAYVAYEEVTKMKNNNRPTLNFTNDVDQVDVAMAFGYYKNEPTVAMFHDELLILIPKDVLQIALEQGWEMEVSE